MFSLSPKVPEGAVSFGRIKDMILEQSQTVTILVSSCHPVEFSRGVDANQGIVIQSGDPWPSRVDLNQIEGKVIGFRAMMHGKTYEQSPVSLDWPIKTTPVQATETDLAPPFCEIDEEISIFINEHSLGASIAWLRVVAPDVFDDARFEIELLPAEDGEENLLAFRVYGSFASSDFRERRHRLCEMMRNANHRELSDIICISQRRVNGDGRETVSYHGSLPA